jgi:phage-related minor tail protein
MGGPVAGGVPYLVGERGPELFVPAAAGRIVPNNAIGGQIVQHFHVQAGLPPQWEAQLGAVTQIAAASARESVSRELGGRR